MDGPFKGRLETLVCLRFDGDNKFKSNWNWFSIVKGFWRFWAMFLNYLSLRLICQFDDLFNYENYSKKIKFRFI